MNSKMLLKPRDTNDESRQSKSGFKTGIWIIIVVVSSTWTFVLGIMVGREMVPIPEKVRNLEQYLINRQQDEIQSQLNEFDTDQEANLDPSVFNFYKELQKNDTSPPVDLNRAVQKPTETAVVDKPPPSTAIPQPKPESSTENAGEEPKKQPDIKSTPPVTETTEQFSIQVASFSQTRDADALIAQLKKSGYAAYRASTSITGQGTFYRVRIGPFKSRTEAKRIAGQLQQAGFQTFLARD